MDAVSLADYEQAARAGLDEATWNYVAGGSGDERTLADNNAAWNRIRLAPRVLQDVSRIDTAVTLWGTALPHPVLLAPAAAHAGYHPDAERGTLRGAAQAGALAVMSNLGSTPVAELGEAAAGPWWFQLYVQADRGFTTDLVRAAEQAGAGALVVTVDTPLLGARDRDRRLGGHTVDGLQPPNMPRIRPQPGTGRRHERIYNPHLNPAVTWTDLQWLAQTTRLPVLCKGILRPDDAARAADAGYGVIVSNHGARNLDTVPATADVLAVIADTVAGRVPVLVDGGIRRGIDVVKALALGADAVLIGRPAVWGLAAAGAAGVADVVDILRAELLMAMALLGATSPADLGPDALWRPAGPDPATGPR